MTRQEVIAFAFLGVVMFAIMLVMPEFVTTKHVPLAFGVLLGACLAICVHRWRPRK